MENYMKFTTRQYDWDNSCLKKNVCYILAFKVTNIKTFVIRFSSELT